MQIHSSPRPARPTGGRRPLALRWLLLAWAVATLMAWFVPWRSSPESIGIGPLGAAWLAAGTPILPLVLALLSLAAWRVGHSRIAIVMAVVAGLAHSLGAAATLVVQTPVFDQRVDCRIEGRVVGLVDVAPDRRRFRLTVTRAVALDGHDPQARQVCGKRLVGGRLRLSDYQRGTSRRLLAAGHEYRLVARLKPLHGHVNPGGFDYRRWLFRHQIIATGYLREPPVGLGPAPGWQAGMDRLRSLARERLAASVRQADEFGLASQARAAGAALAHGLALGDRGELTERQWEMLLASGTNHLLAISGLHVGMIAALVALLVRSLWGRLAVSGGVPAQRVAALAAVMAGWAYALIAGLSIPTLRAALMLTVLLLGVLLQRRWRLGDLWLLAFALVLAIDPLAPLDMGFWLSFAAVLLIIVFVRGREALWRPLELLRLQWLLTLGLLPLTWALFDRIAFASLPANLVAVPLVSMLITPLALADLMVSLLATLPGLPAALSLGGGIAWLIGWLGAGLFAMLDWLVAVFPESSRAPPNGLALFFLAIGLVWLMLPRRFPGRAWALVLLVPAVAVGPSRPEAGRFEATVLDVGQGLAVLVWTANHALVYDAGPRFGRFDTGEAIVLPAMRSLGIGELDRVVISHDARDHAGGLAAVRSTFSEAAVVGLVGPAQGLEAGVGSPCRHGDGWTWDGVRFELARPPFGSANDRSCVLRVVGRTTSLLLTGDTESAGESWLRRQFDLRADVVLAGHHGSSTSSTAAFIEATGARHALVSAGFLNRWGHPSPEVVARWRAAGATVWRTDRHGALRIVSGEVGASRGSSWPFAWRLAASEP
ncbi:DNA internalization-related competence protein ComEC/Rec2 [Guyparkeria hydrothermalis]|uniref:DNA internalization-related competence protein ComEC/Rec2 n=1 Tax=Guyparkeria hydrothermalis TaxID=923 RepID=UPI002021194E|nr:DNA internalization-related competence protein ComEC/Rec2 [Guyparkeria hydrothermalis]MCL7743459.1 DNA internalization-related competence protein ComEC/Rec2 [Guyparkeria hydrothermalis]